ncbi:MAG: hypothetical protein GY710_26440 [Desulfobacteraceae bacterium]|nr:hypothetical protein [Desulfobacteraceae bacterium]
MECSCEINCNLDDDYVEYIIEKYNHTAPRERECSECKTQIYPGEEHLYLVSLNGDSIYRYRACEDCEQLINTFFHDWIVEQVMERLKDGILEEDIGVSEDCISGLSPRNMEFVCKLVEEVWEPEQK